MNPYYRQLLSDAKKEVREYESNAPEAEEYSAVVFDSLVEGLDVAMRLTSREAFESQIESVSRQRIDQAPLDGNLMPSFEELRAAMMQESEQN